MRAAQERGLPLESVDLASEKPGEGLRGIVAGRAVRITGRSKLTQLPLGLPPAAEGLECLVFFDDQYTAALRFHDEPRAESHPFVQHLLPRHRADKVILLSGDRENEVEYFARQLGIALTHAGKSPEDKVAIVRHETALARTLYVGDGINDAPAMMTATVGVAFGKDSDITAEAADAVVLEPSLAKVDELMHIGRRMRGIALQSALGGMVLSVIGMAAAAAGYLPPIIGAVAQEVIDLAAVLNAVRVALPSRDLTDFSFFPIPSPHRDTVAIVTFLNSPVSSNEPGPVLPHPRLRSTACKAGTSLPSTITSTAPVTASCVSFT